MAMTIPQDSDIPNSHPSNTITHTTVDMIIEMQSMAKRLIDKSRVAIKMMKKEKTRAMTMPYMAEV